LLEKHTQELAPGFLIAVIAAAVLFGGTQESADRAAGIAQQCETAANVGIEEAAKIRSAMCLDDGRFNNNGNGTATDPEPERPLWARCLFSADVWYIKKTELLTLQGLIPYFLPPGSRRFHAYFTHNNFYLPPVHAVHLPYIYNDKKRPPIRSALCLHREKRLVA
jgi:hypothetical protein